MINKEVVLTFEGLKKLEQELEYLKTVKRREVAERIKQALSFGDISENSEYDEAKNEQAQVEGRIVQLEGMLKRAKVIDEDDIKTDVVSIGSKVSIYDMEYDEEVEYYIVGSTEADPSKYKISNESPVGKALIGKAKDEIVEVQVPDGVIKYKILDIRK
ncbi:transcription elongation factor GreA [Acetivibrio saccincola]|jgi:transcription elongation factor GreA|uniref:Transcription elongation factor GreA n=1 Tax=Acetivibrio saccincola TaxID=1677857 RepID=A0A2K9ETS0_9FIRM|nr:transcription elongation factor GreA [Acetivibrio saccincola]AUG58930.1 Transcription elongation factor GreA [Acetivibrio saccincola]NLW26944.1 transcription elongation factor GreA [Acetivibrio saccincola]PQQ65989.1 transcription elongation factor GreA [Acetivibrio saccincola]HOA96367.1 transcription elongation factor GreA [Acetivibrio saccincola]HQD29898.1 transcription elongation factor GreA [Acetivibrio saccincola]